MERAQPDPSVSACPAATGNSGPLAIPASMAQAESLLNEIAQARAPGVSSVIQGGIAAVEPFRMAFESVPDALLIVNRDGTITLINSQLERLFGYRRGELIGQAVEVLLPERFRQSHPGQRSTYFDAPHVRPMGANLDLSARHAVGHEFPVEISLSPIQTQVGLMVVATIRDFSEKKKTEDQLRQWNLTLESRVAERTAELSASNRSLQAEIQVRLRAEAEVLRINADLARARDEAIAANEIKDQFLANMSHELRTPLNAVIGYSELLQLTCAQRQDDAYLADLQRINQAGKHLLALINDILDLSKIAAGKMRMELEIVSVEPLLEELRETVRPLAAQNGNLLEIRLVEPLGLVCVDPTRLRQCLLNLLSNACKFTQQGQVVLSAGEEQVDGRNWLALRVEDTGVGMSDEQIARLFQPFTQADNSTTRKFGGTGLGLVITRKLCEAMNGRISVASELGTGSTFTIHLPICGPLELIEWSRSGCIGGHSAT